MSSSSSSIDWVSKKNSIVMWSETLFPLTKKMSTLNKSTKSNVKTVHLFVCCYSVQFDH